MSLEANNRRDAEALDAFWDDLVLGQNAPLAGTPDEELVMSFQNTMALDDPGAEHRLRRLVFGSAPAATTAGAPTGVMPGPKPAPIRSARSILHHTRWAAAALAVILVGALVAAQNAGLFGFQRGDDTPTVIPAAIAQLDASPAALASPTVNDSAILWTLPFDGTNVEIGATALADSTLYRLIRSDDFTGVQAVDTVTGTEKWRSAQTLPANGLAADESGAYLATASGVVALDAATGEARWSATTRMQAWTLAAANGDIYVWDGQRTLAALDASDGLVAWQGVADIDTSSSSVLASQSPVASGDGIAAVSGTGTVVLFDTEGNFTGTAGRLEPESIVLVAAPHDTVAIAGLARQETAQPWARKLLLASPATGSTVWETDYNALVTGLTVTDSMAVVLADNPGMASADPYPPNASPQLYGFDLATGLLYFTPDSGWVTDAGASPFVSLTAGPAGPIAISKTGQLNFFGTDNPMLQAVASVPGVLPNEISSDDVATYASTTDGSLTALVPQLAGIEPQPYSDSNLDWSVPLSGQLVDFGGMAYSGGLVYRLIDNGTGPTIEATFAATGQPAWTVPFAWSTDQLVADAGPDPHDSAQTWTGSGTIFAIDAENRLIAIDGASGTLNWQHAYAEPVVSMVFDSGTLYVWDETGTMTAFTANDGSVQWETATDRSGSQTNDHGMPVPALTSDLIAMIDAGGTLLAFDRASGEIVWSIPGFDGTNSRIARQGNAAWNQTEMFVVVSAQGDAQADGTVEQSVSGILAETGEHIWDDWMQGPLVQPVNADETLVVVTADQLNTGKSVAAEGTPIVDAESYNHYVWTGTGDATPDGGGERLFALRAGTGEIVWIRTTAAGGFTDLFTRFPTGSGALHAITSDGLLVSPSRGNGSIDGEPASLGGPVIGTVSSGESGSIGSFATLADGTLVAFGGIPFSQQG